MRQGVLPENFKGEAPAFLIRAALHRDSRGSVMVEAALATALLMIVVFSGLELFFNLSTRMALHFALQNAVRQAQTGLKPNGTVYYAEGESGANGQRVQDLETLIKTEAAKWGVKVTDGALQFCKLAVPPAADPCETLDSIGGAGEMFKVSIVLSVGTIIPTHAYTIRQQVIARSEDYS